MIWNVGGKKYFEGGEEFCDSPRTALSDAATTDENRRKKMEARGV